MGPRNRRNGVVHPLHGFLLIPTPCIPPLVCIACGGSGDPSPQCMPQHMCTAGGVGVSQWGGGSSCLEEDVVAMSSGRGVVAATGGVSVSCS